MFDSIIKDVKREFNFGNMVSRLIIINIAFFVFINLVKLFLFIGNGAELPSFYDDFLHFFCISSEWWHNLTHPWVIFTSIFLHEDFWHILWNMLFLYWFGRIVGDFIGNQRILPLYLLAGIVGGLAYFVTANILPYGENGGRFALGASGAVMGIVVAAGTISPDYIMRLLFLGDVKLKYIVAVLVFLDLIALADNYNTGGHFAHLGGAFFGWLFIKRLRSGEDWSVPVNNILDSIDNFFSNLFNSRNQRNRKGPRVVYKSTDKPPQRRTHSRKGSVSSNDVSHQDRLDSILDKIKKSGYDSLSEEEKEFLFNASKK